MKKIKWIIFDLDGTLVDTDILHFNSWNEILLDYNIKISYDYYLNNLAGKPTALNAEILLTKYCLPNSITDLSNKKDTLTTFNIESTSLNFMPYAYETLLFFYKKSIPIFLVTGSPRIEVDFILEKKEIKKYFESTITRDDVKKSKPDPEPYLKIIENYKLDPKHTIVFEDTENGVKSAKTASLNCFAIQQNSELHKKLLIADGIFENLNQAIHFLLKKGSI